jgi:hypothetical protein
LRARRPLRAEGENSEALGIVEHVISDAGTGSDHLYISRWVLYEAGEAALAAGDTARLQLLLDIVSARHRRGLSPALDGMIARLAARVAAAEGRHAEVADQARIAVDLFDSMHMPFWGAVARLEHGEWLSARGRDDEAEHLLEHAAVTFTELGAAPMLARAQASMRSDADRSPSTLAAMIAASSGSPGRAR